MQSMERDPSIDEKSRFANMSDQEYIHVVLEEEEDSPPRRT